MKLSTLERRMVELQRKERIRADNSTAEATVRPFKIRYEPAPIQDKSIGLHICTHGRLKFSCKSCGGTPEYRAMLRKRMAMNLFS